MKYTPEEQELIQIFNNEEIDLKTDRVAELLMSKVGDMSFNSKLTADLSLSKQPPDHINNKNFLRYFTYKTRGLDQFASTALKLDTALELREEQLPIENREKLTLAEYSKISDLNALDNVWGQDIEEISNNCNNADFRELYSNMQRSSDLIEKLSRGALELNDQKAGDILMFSTAKTVAASGARQNLTGHGGKLEEAFMTKYSHIAPLYIDRSNPDSPTVTKSDINSELRSEALSLGEILASDTLRIDPTKLVDKKHINALEKIDYGYRKDKSGRDLVNEKGEKIKITWQEVMRERYEQLSNALHEGQVPHQIKELDQSLARIYNECEELNEKLKPYRTRIKRIKERESFIDELFNDLNNGHPKYKEIEKEIIRQQKIAKQLKSEIRKDNDYYEKLEEALSIKSETFLKLNEKRDTEIEYKKSQNLHIDPKRLGVGHWLHPKTVLVGHWFSENNFRDLSEKMYNASPDQKEMICSEFAARSIASTTDQLNRITSLDLQAAGLIDKEERIVKEPISKQEDFQNLHPGRLAKILESSGCVQKVENKFLKDLIQLDNIDKSQIKAAEYTANLSEKIYGILQNSESKEDFKDKASKVVGAHLKAAKVEGDIIKSTHEQLLEPKLDSIYQQHTKQPKGILEKIRQVCIKVLESCKLYTKDAVVKKNLSLMVNEISQNTQETQQAKQKAVFAQAASIGEQLRIDMLKRSNNPSPISFSSKISKAQSATRGI